MTKIFNGRFTAKTEEPFVVFLIGMRINNGGVLTNGSQLRRQWGQ